MQLASYLGRSVDDLLDAEPFVRWQVTRTVEDDPELELRYEFETHGVDVICDGADRISTVFVRRGDGESLIDIPFAMSRKQVLERFGAPEKSGGGVRIPGLGDRGPWDRFTIPEGFLHLQYGVGRDEIEQVTFMRHDVAP